MANELKVKNGLIVDENVTLSGSLSAGTGPVALYVSDQQKVAVNTLETPATLTVNGNISASDCMITPCVCATDLFLTNDENFRIPPGGIIMFSGTTAPDGWVLCNGGTTTLSTGEVVNVPDLQSRFIVGYNSSDTDYNAIGKTGGAKTVQLQLSQIPSHNHSASVSGGDHSHPSGNISVSGGSHSHSSVVTGGSTGNRRCDGSCKSITSLSTSGISGGGHGHTISISNSGAHGHSITIDASGGGGSHENRPPYYVLAYIMKL